MAKIEGGVASFFGGGFLSAVTSITGINYSFLSLLLFALGGILIGAGLYEEFKTPKAK